MRDTVTFDWPRNPFPGLRPFREDEALIFYGRNSHKDEVLARLNNSQLVFVTGPSGCGKSSLIKAGVLPALQAGLLTNAGYRWKTLQMRPGRRPLVNLAAAFKSAQSQSPAEGDDRPALDDVLNNEGSGLWLAASAVAPIQKASDSDKAPVRLLLLIDQFEEIFGEQIQEPADVDRFVGLLVRFAERPHPNLFIVVTLRSDYLGQCANFEGLAESINRTQFLTPVLTADELGQAIARPAEDYNGEVEPQLVEQIIRDMRTGTAYHPDSLPLMQHALLWMWSKAWAATGAKEPPRPPFNEGSCRTQLTLKSYRDHGGIEGILDRHAEDVLREAVGESEKSRKIAESIFRRLSERDSEGRYRRSPTSAERLCGIAGCELDEFQHIIRPFEHPDVCFLEQRRSESTNEILVDVSHESLIRQWNTAKAWADAEAEKVRKFRELAQAALTWEKRNRSNDFLKRRGELEVIKAWWDEETPNESWARRYAVGPEGGNLSDVFHRVDEYLRVSAEVDQSEQLATERSRIAQASELSRRQRDRYLAIAIFLLLVSAFVGTLLLWQTRETNAYRVRVTALLADEALKIFGPARALLAVMEGIGDPLPELPEIRRVGYRALAQLRERRILEGHGAQVQSIQFAPRRPGLPSYLLITTSNDGNLRFWNYETGALIDTIYVPDARFLTARWSPDGKWIFISARDMEAYLLAPCSRDSLRPFFEECASVNADKKRLFKQRVGNGSFSPDSRWLVTGGFGATTKLWDITSETVEQKRDFGRSGSFSVGAAFSPDAQLLALGNSNEQENPGGEIRIFRLFDVAQKADARPEKTLGRLQGAPQPSGPRALMTSIAFHPIDPNILMATYQDGTMKFWDIAKNEDKAVRLEGGVIFQGVFNNDGEWAATAHEDGMVRLWPLRAALPNPQVLRGHQGTVYTVAYSPDGTTIASGSSDRTARIWSQMSALARAPLRKTIPPDAFSTGKASVRELPSQLILTYNNADFMLTRPTGFKEPIAAAVSPNGQDAVIVPKYGRPFLFSLASKGYIVELPGRPTEWRQVGFFNEPEPEPGATPDRIVGVTQDGQVFSWPYFPNLQALKQYASDNLPFVGSERMPIRADVACQINAKPESDCPSVQDEPGQD